MARKAILWLVSVGLGAVIVYLVLWGLIAMLGGSLRYSTGYWRATYCDVQGCPKGSRMVVLDGVFFEGEVEQCYLLQPQRAGYYDHQDYYLKEGSCEISKKPFRVDDSPLVITQEGAYAIWFVIACVLSIPIYTFISGEGLGKLRRWIKKDNQLLWGLFGLTLVPAYVLAAGYTTKAFTVFTVALCSPYVVFIVLAWILRGKRLAEKGGFYQKISDNLGTVAVCFTAIVMIFFLVLMAALAAGPIPSTSPFFPFDQRFTNWYIYLVVGSGFLLWGKRA